MDIVVGQPRKRVRIHTEAPSKYSMITLPTILLKILLTYIENDGKITLCKCNKHVNKKIKSIQNNRFHRKPTHIKNKNISDKIIYITNIHNKPLMLNKDIDMILKNRMTIFKQQKIYNFDNNNNNNISPINSPISPISPIILPNYNNKKKNQLPPKTPKLSPIKNMNYLINLNDLRIDIDLSYLKHNNYNIDDDEYMNLNNSLKVSDLLQIDRLSI